MARLHDFGLLVPTLDLHCVRRGWQLCAHRNALTRNPKGNPSWWFLWDRESPLSAIGSFDASPELREIAQAGARSFLPRIATRTLQDGWRQLWRVETGKGITPRSARGFASGLRSVLPEEAQRAAAADQASGRPTIVLFPSLEGPLHLALWTGALLVAARCVRRNRPAGAWLVAATAGFLALHALVVALGNPPFGRLQGRVAWLIAYAVVIAAWTQRAGDSHMGGPRIETTQRLPSGSSP